MMAISLEQRWDNLAPDPLHTVFQLCDSGHPLSFYLGRDTLGKRLLLLVTPEEPPYIRDMRAVEIRSFKRGDGKWSLLLTLQDMALAPMFSLLCNDLIESSRRTGRPPDSSLAFVLTRLSSWRRLLERGSPDLLTESQIRGLSGEIFFLSELCMHLGQTEALLAWVGPDRAHQDFQTRDTAWEVKTIRPDAVSATISSEYQLWQSSRDVYLVVIELGETTDLSKAGAFSLNSLVADMRLALAPNYDANERFTERLEVARYVARAEYDSPVFTVRSTRIFTVDSGFPSITPENLSDGITGVSYDVILPSCGAYLLPPLALRADKRH
jgi:hypothetical protein